jgi:hypothetical protein
MPKIIIDDAKGLYQTSGKGVVGLTQSKTVNASLASGVISSGAIIVPANSLITAFHTVVTTTLAGSANPKVKVGTAAGGNELAVVKKLASTTADVIATIGLSTNTEVDTALANGVVGHELGLITAGQAYRAAETNVHFTILADAPLTAGAAQFTVEFITFE